MDVQSQCTIEFLVKNWFKWDFDMFGKLIFWQQCDSRCLRSLFVVVFLSFIFFFLTTFTNFWLLIDRQGDFCPWRIWHFDKWTLGCLMLWHVWRFWCFWCFKRFRCFWRFWHFWCFWHFTLRLCFDCMLWCFDAILWCYALTVCFDALVLCFDTMLWCFDAADASDASDTSNTSDTSEASVARDALILLTLYFQLFWCLWCFWHFWCFWHSALILCFDAVLSWNAFTIRFDT